VPGREPPVSPSRRKASFESRSRPARGRAESRSQREHTDRGQGDPAAAPAAKARHVCGQTRSQRGKEDHRGNVAPLGRAGRGQRRAGPGTLWPRFAESSSRDFDAAPGIDGLHAEMSDLAARAPGLELGAGNSRIEPCRPAARTCREFRERSGRPPSPPSRRRATSRSSCWARGGRAVADRRREEDPSWSFTTRRAGLARALQ